MSKFILKPGIGVWKFVRVAGQYRFLSTEGFFALAHSEAVMPGEVAETAGMIGIGAKHWGMICGYSTTLNVSMDDKDFDNLSKMFGERR